MLLGTLGGSLLGNMLASKGMNSMSWTGQRTIRAGDEITWAADGFIWAGIGATAISRR